MLSEEIRRARGGESQQAFATRIGAGIATLQRWERGATVPVHHLHVEALKREGVPAEAFEATDGAAVAL